MDSGLHGGAGLEPEPLKYYQEPGRLVVDMRPEGVSYMPVASRRTGRVRTEAPSMHVHRGMVEICHCLRGSLAFETPDGEYAFRPGCVFVSREAEPHRMKSNPKGLFVYRVLVNLPAKGRCFDGLDARDSEWLRRRIEALPRRFVAPGAALRTAFERLFAAYCAKGMDADRRRIELRRCALDVLLACVDASERDVVNSRQPQVEEWMRRMERDPVGDYPLEAMSRAAHMSPTGFVRAFKTAAGLPPQAYLRNCRIRAAAKMLDAGESVLATALRLKFCSAQYFATVFKAEMGVSPRNWRDR